MTTSVHGAVAERASLATAGLEAMRRQIAAARPDLSESTLTYRAAVLLLLGPQLRFNIDRLSSRTRYPRPQVAACVRRLFDHGVWGPTGPDYTWLTCEAPEFWQDVAVAEGRLCRRRNAAGVVEWAEPGTWTKAYDFVTRDTSLTIAYVDAPSAAASTDEEDDREPVREPEPVLRSAAEADLTPALAAAAVLEQPFAGAAAGETAGRAGWVKVEGLRRSDLFPDAQWLS